MQRGYVGFPFSTGRQPANAGIAPPGLTTIQGNGTMKASIIVFNTTPGTYSFIVPAGVFKIRVFVAGGSGYSSTAGGAGAGYTEKVFNVIPGQTFTYTVGAGGVVGTPNGGTSTFGGVLSATGSTANGGAPGIGSGGDINSTGGAGPGAVGSGGACGHRFGNGSPGIPNGGNAAGGAGFTQSGTSGSGTAAAGGSAGVDGFGLGLVPGQSGGYGAGGAPGLPGGIGAGAGSVSGSSAAGGGMIGGAGNLGGNGGVGVEVIG